MRLVHGLGLINYCVRLSCFELSSFVHLILPGQFQKQVIATKSKIYIVMEYVSGGQLSDKLVGVLYLYIILDMA